jgi:hypothetical protein
MRRLRQIALAGLVFILAVIAVIHLYAYVFRIRTERLLADLKTLQIEKTPAVAALKLRHIYHSQVVDQKPCSEEHCVFSIALTEWQFLVRPSSHPSIERARNSLLRALRVFGMRLSYFQTELRIEDGKLRGLDVRFYHAYVEGESFENFGARAITVGNMGTWLNRQGVYEHPNLLVWEPAACTGCSGAITADFTSQASHEEFERALEFNLSCITRFHVCRTIEEFLPSAAQLLQEDRSRLAADRNWKVPCDSRTAWILGRDSDFVNLASIREITPDEQDHFLSISVEYTKVRALKGASMQLNDIHYPKRLVENLISDTNASKPRAEWIVFLSKILDKPAAWSECSVISNTPENLSAVLEGIAADRTATIGKE